MKGIYYKDGKFCKKIPLSVYIHIPFCVQKCLYCDFLSAPATEDIKESYVKALLNEIDEWKELVKKDYYISTIFIGGGTPTALSANQLTQICRRLSKLTDTQDEHKIEFTIEANPGTITKEHASCFRDMGINRVSMGLQSAQAKELKALGRIHSYKDFLDSVTLLRKNGIENINVDLMSDIPYQSLTSYKDTLEKICALDLEHISSYSLIVEPGTPFHDMYEKDQLEIPDEDCDRQMYEMTQQILEKNGYFRYEISNYAKEGKECRHNITYWNMGQYLGLGLGASSLFMGYRFRNCSDLESYIKLHLCKNAGCNEKLMIEKLHHLEEVHKVSKKDAMEEFVFLGLRMHTGISRKRFLELFGCMFDEIYADILKPLFEQKLLAEDENHDRIYLTNLGIDVSNTVLAEFLL